ncbi:hypothetical protein N7468_004391 [Penicillium chermesinum]|uniref:Uncharacterized protein n=1 Tax=Penicillium chermesinum TaxID=63820 RepID=A0A9W9PBB4_9EURO|nr:uncharacterized protein N7468_004391 [Penicillium chermesinum]KAJ5239772.1 hypothetical protein N7468_004391 [Penicillium chermesinum]KAJ6166651.1 hypothetical protein N7470_002098 [Penicillium chermesinum]
MEADILSQDAIQYDESFNVYPPTNFRMSAPSDLLPSNDVDTPERFPETSLITSPERSADEHHTSPNILHHSHTTYVDPLQTLDDSLNPQPL